MTTNRLSREYRVRGLDRFLYRHPPEWLEGTFVQSNEFEGLLTLQTDGLQSPVETETALSRLDRIAEQFRLAVSKRIGCLLTMSIKRTVVPEFSAVGVDAIHDTFHIRESVVDTVAPIDPPVQIEQLPEGARRWIHTLTEARTMSAHPDEVLKRLYLVIEELKDVYPAVLDATDLLAIEELALLRDFVSHPLCDRKKVPPFIASRTPSALVSPAPALCVRYDRTDVEHRNFVGRFDPRARAVVNKLLAAAIASLP
jgi:hypothetical protein